MKTPAESDLEQFIHRELRALAPRRAPRTLEHRVLAELERRAALAWWHRSYAYWPAWARAAFLVLAGTGVFKAAFLALDFAQAGLGPGPATAVFGPVLHLAERVMAVAGWTANLCNQVLASIPSWWIYGGLGFLALMYVTCFTLGATAYRVLYRTR